MYTRLGLRALLVLTIPILSLMSAGSPGAQEPKPLDARFWRSMSLQGLAADQGSDEQFTSPFGVADKDLNVPLNSFAEHLFFIGTVPRDVGRVISSPVAYFPPPTPLAIETPLPPELAVNSRLAANQRTTLFNLAQDLSGWVEVVNAVGSTPFGTFGSSRDQFCSGELAARYPRVAEAADFNPSPELLSSDEFGSWLVDLASSSASLWDDIDGFGAPLAGLTPPDANEGLNLFEQFVVRQCIVATTLAAVLETRSYWGDTLPNPEFADGTFAARLLYEWYEPVRGKLAIPVRTTSVGLEEATRILHSIVAYTDYLESPDTPRSALDAAVVKLLGAVYAKPGDGGILSLRGDARVMLSDLVPDLAKRKLFELAVHKAKFPGFMPGQIDGADIFKLMPTYTDAAIFDVVRPYLDPVDFNDLDIRELVSGMGFGTSSDLPPDQAALIEGMAKDIREWLQSDRIKNLISVQRCAVFEYMIDRPFDWAAATQMIAAWMDGLAFETSAAGNFIRFETVLAPFWLEQVELDRRVLEIPTSNPNDEAVAAGVENDTKAFITGTCHFSTGHRPASEEAKLLGVHGLDGAWAHSLPLAQRETLQSFADLMHSLDYSGGSSDLAKTWFGSAVAWSEALPANVRVMTRAFQRESYAHLQQSREARGAATISLGSNVIQSLEFAKWRQAGEEAASYSTSPETDLHGEAMLVYPVKLSGEPPLTSAATAVPWLSDPQGKRCLAAGKDGLFIATDPRDSRDCIRFSVTLDDEGATAVLDGRDATFAYLQTRLANASGNPLANLVFWKFGLLEQSRAPELAAQLRVLATYSDLLKSHPIAIELL